MTQLTRTLLLLVAVAGLAAGLGYYAWKVVYEGDEVETKKKDLDEHLFSPLKLDEKGGDGSVATIEFVKLVLTSATGEQSTLERDSGGTWKMTAPLATSVDKIAVDSVLSQLQSSKFKYVADEAPDAAALAKYGLAKPSFVLEAEALVGDRKERRSVKLVGGAENSFNGSIFMLRNDEKKVWGAEGGVKWAFQKTTFDLREKELVALDEPKVSAIDVKTKNNVYALTRDAEKNWVARPAVLKKGEEPSWPADNGAVGGSINALKSERATAFPAPGAPTGLEDPFEELTFTTEGGTVHVKLGKASEKVYLQRDDARGTLVGEVKDTVLSHFDRNPRDLRDKSVALFKRDSVAKVTFHPTSGPDIVVEKDVTDAGTGETWRVTAPQAGPAKQFKLAAALWALGSIKASEVVEEHPKDLKKYGLDNAQFIAFAAADGHELARIAIGKEAKGKPGQKFMKGTRDAVVTADTSRLNDLPGKVEDVLEAAPKPADSGL